VGADLQILGRYRESIEWLEPLMKDLPENGHYNVFLLPITSLAISYSGLNEYRNSFELCTKALNQFEGVVPVDDPLMVDLYKAMGDALVGLKRPKEALTCAKRALLATEKTFGQQHLNSFLALQYMTNVYAALGNFKKALEPTILPRLTLRRRWWVIQLNRKAISFRGGRSFPVEKHFWIR
jgi:tetratricopeptide (TPR) repeat protein